MCVTARRIGRRAGPLAACLAIAASGHALGQGPLRRLVLPAGTVIPVRLGHSLSSGTAAVGDRFSVTVRTGRDDASLPEGARIEGIVTGVTPPVDGRPGALEMDFRRLVTRQGRSWPLTGSLVSLDTDRIGQLGSGNLTDATGDRAGSGAARLRTGNNLVNTLLIAAEGYAVRNRASTPGGVVLEAGTLFGVRLDRQLVFDTDRPGPHGARRRAVMTNDREEATPTAELPGSGIACWCPAAQSAAQAAPGTAGVTTRPTSVWHSS